MRLGGCQRAESNERDDRMLPWAVNPDTMTEATLQALTMLKQGEFYKLASKSAQKKVLMGLTWVSAIVDPGSLFVIRKGQHERHADGCHQVAVRCKQVAQRDEDCGSRRHFDARDRHDAQGFRAFPP